MQVIQLSRAGRKRKHGRRDASGHLVREYVNYAAMAAEQPHRRDLPADVRLSQDATTELGRLFLMRQITEPQYLAGQEYARRIGAARATMEGPKAMATNGNWSGCGGLCRPNDEECECNRRIRAYQELFEVVIKCGRRVELVVKRIIGFNEKLGHFELYPLTAGLTALASHLRLTERGKRAYVRN